MIGVNILRTTMGMMAQIASRVPSWNEKFRIRERLSGPFTKGPCVWLHGASLGECKMLLSLSRALRKDLPELPPFLITTQKPEVLEFLRPIAGSENFAVSMAPIDSPFALKRFFKTVQPVLLILAENELWPGYLESFKNCKKPPVALISGRFYRCLDSDCFSSIGFVSMQTGADLTRFVAAGDYEVPAKTIVGGDWKLLSWALSGQDITATQVPQVDTAFLSFHKEEWKPLSEMLTQAVLAKETVVVAPRFESELPLFCAGLEAANIPSVEWPKVKKGAVSLVTTYGKLTEVLKNSKSSVIGGSFARTLGVHDFWESLKLGVATCIGPYSRGQKTSVEALLREGAIAQIKKPSEYLTRSIPTREAASRFLAHEREKVSASYKAFLKFIGETLEQNPTETK